MLIKGNVKKHLKRMHADDITGHVTDLGLELANNSAQLSIPVTSTYNMDELDETNEQPVISTNTNKIRTANENIHQFYQQVFQIKEITI